MVGDEDPASLTIETEVIVNTMSILGFGAGEREINGETLEGLLGDHGGTGSSGFFTLLGLDTCGALFEHSIMVTELGDTFDKAVSVVKVVVTWVTKTLVPQNVSCGTNALVTPATTTFRVL